MLQRNNTSTYVQQFKRNRQIVLADLSVNVHLISANKLFLKERVVALVLLNYFFRKATSKLDYKSC